MKRPVESLQDFKVRIAAIIGDKTEHITGARRTDPMLVRKNANRGQQFRSFEHRYC
jgi:hypothetical protein